LRNKNAFQLYLLEKGIFVFKTDYFLLIKRLISNHLGPLIDALDGVLAQLTLKRNRYRI